MLYLTLSTGMGGGFVVDGQIYRGALGGHPEVGHQSINFRCAQGLPFDVLHASDGVSDALRGLKHRRGVHQRFYLAGIRVLHAFLEGQSHRLGERQIAGRGKRHDPLSGLRIDV